MAFRLKGTKSIGSQLARVVSKEVSEAVASVTGAPREESVHDARKHVKKIRAVLHLLQLAIGDDYDGVAERIRSAAHRMSAVRDADALITMMKALRRQSKGVITPALARTANVTLKARRRAAYSKLAGRPLANVRQTLKRSRGPLRTTIRGAASNRTVRDGVKRGYRRARRAMAEAAAARTEDARFHAWRRRVKDHWYQLRLVEGISRKARKRVHGRLRRLERLQDWLGDDHNLAVLREAILAEPHRFGDARAVAVILGCIDKRQTALRRRAMRHGRALFSRKPSSFRKLISRSWP